MLTRRLNHSATTAEYEVLFESAEEEALTDDQLYDAVEAFNYGGATRYRDGNRAVLAIYID